MYNAQGYYICPVKIKESFINNNKKYKLGLLVIIKNERMVIEELIQHYIWQGVQHFYIIDNESTDETKAILKPYIDNGIISYYNMPGKHIQAKYYNIIFNSNAKEECEWLIICDADEYIYNRIKNKTILSYIESLNNKISNISLEWKMFGSSGFIMQPKEIRKNFLNRKKDTFNETKQIINTSLTSELIIHDHIYINKNSIINPIELALNHYAIMSKEYFEKIKMTRGDVNSITFDNIRDWTYFNNYDTNEVYDDELANLFE
jgi:hypothetical protein